MNDAYHKRKMDELARSKAVEFDSAKDAVATVFVNAAEKGEISTEKMYRHADFFDAWEGGKNYSVGEIVTDPQYRDGSYLFKIRQAHTSQDIFPPHSVPSLYERIPKSDEGSHDNPIEFDASVGIALTKGLFYLEGSILYECIRDSGVPIYNRLADLVNNYVMVSN